MKNKFKRKYIYIIASIFIILSCSIKLYYLNFIEYPKPIYFEYTSNDIIQQNGFEMNFSGYHIYTKEELVNKYGKEMEDMADDMDVFLNLTLKNISSEDKYIEIGSLSLQIDSYKSTSPNPYLTQYFNENKTTGYYESDEESTITLIYPVDDINSNLEIILSLYPEYISAQLKKLT